MGMDGDSAAKVAAAMSTLGLAVAAIDLFKKPVAAAAGGEFPPEVLQLLQAIAYGMEASIAQLNDILDAINGLGLQVQGYPPNCDYVTTVRINCQAINQSYPVPSLVVPDGFSVLVKAWPGNAVGAFIFVITNPAPNQSMAYPLVFNEAVRLSIKDTGKIHLFTNVAGSQATVTVEQRSG